MANEKIPLFGGKVKAKKIGSFLREGFAFDVVRPGVDIQGRNRITWTQVVWQGVPVWEMKMANDLPAVMERFNYLWDNWFADNKDLALKAMEQEVADRTERFKDGVSGVEVAPTAEDDKPEKKYSS